MDTVLHKYKLSGHLSRQYFSLQHLSISGISRLLPTWLTWFWPNFKIWFLGPFLTDANCHDDICPGNICPGDICPYQEYLSYYWPDLTNFKVGSWDHLNANCHGDIFPHNICPGKILKDQNFCWKKFFNQK